MESSIFASTQPMSEQSDTVQAKSTRPTTKHRNSNLDSNVANHERCFSVIGNALGGLFQVGPGYDPEEEAFIRQMKRRKKKKGRSL